jgi:lipopolysaccharide/colanic/teichoic acid biosynthesis glycosyltransferase
VSRLYARVGKRACDLGLGTLGLLVLLVPGALIALAIAIDSRGSVLFVQKRVGIRGREFSMFKFRSMVAGSEFAGKGALVERNDARITRVGRWLRKTSLDELPQILNIVRGEMSFIGPRPALPFQAAQYSESQRRRLDVHPGITGLAQVNGRNTIPWEERIRFDCLYVERMSPRLDLEILARTVRVITHPKDQIAERATFGERPGDAPRRAGEADAPAGSKPATSGRRP